MFGNDVVLIGFSFYRGYFRAYDYQMWRDFTVGPGVSGGLDATLAATSLRLFAVDLRSAPTSGPLARWLSAPQRSWSIGPTFHPDATLAMQRAFPVRSSFDIFIVVENTTASQPVIPAIAR